MLLFLWFRSSFCHVKKSYKYYRIYANHKKGLINIKLILAIIIIVISLLIY